MTRARALYLVLMLAIIGVTVWTYRGVQQSVREIRESELHTLVATQSESVDRWFRARPSEADAASSRGGEKRRASAAPGFTELFRTARVGRTGEVYAFDSRGMLLTESRHIPELQALGVTAPASGVLQSSAPRLALTGAREPTDETQPTRLVAAALGARYQSDAMQRQGVILDPYPGYFGEEVIGAWRWLPDYDFGIAVEIPATEAYAPLGYVRIAGAAFSVLLGLGWFVAFVPPRSLWQRLRGGATLRQVGPYTLLRQIGEGAISNVYLARHRHLSRPAAVKVLKPQSTTDEWIARFEREVQLASRLSHPNTIAIYDYGKTGDGVFYYAMEYLEGLSLADLVANYGPVPPARAAYLLRQACASLAQAHANNLIHRDVKPQNIMMCEIHGERDVVKVLDFGLVKRTDDAGTRDLTRSLRILGTPLYMAPERIRTPGEVGPATDVYSLGAVAFHLVTGKRLFETQSDHDLTYHILHETPRRASDWAPTPIPPLFDELIARCLAKDPTARPGSMNEVAAVLDQVLAQHPWTAKQIDAWWRRNWVGRDHPDRRVDAV